jgi:hypothetical protein
VVLCVFSALNQVSVAHFHIALEGKNLMAHRQKPAESNSFEHPAGKGRACIFWCDGAAEHSPRRSISLGPAGDRGRTDCPHFFSYRLLYTVLRQ